MKEEFTELSYRVIGCAINVHRSLGPGLLESIYKRCLAREMELDGISFIAETDVPVTYRGLYFPMAYKADFLVEDRLVIEAKTVHRITDNNRAQALTYMKQLNATEGLLMNFWVARLKDDGISRLVLTH